MDGHKFKKLTLYYNRRSFKSISNFYFCFLFGISLAIYSCGVSAIDKLNSKINSCLKSQNEIDESEWKSISSFIDSNKVSYPNLLDSYQKVDASKLTSKIIEVAKNRKSGELPIIFNPKSNVENSIKPTVKVFIENSGSMDGYVRGKRNFEDAIGGLLVDVKYQYGNENLKVNFINDDIYPVNEIKELDDFVASLEPGLKPFKVGNTQTSVFNKVLKMILDSTNRNSISILVSDCIYSLGASDDTKGSLSYQKNGTKEAFLQKSKEFLFATQISKMISDYDGDYYPYDYPKSPKIDLRNSNATRPYYIWIIGKKELVYEFIEKISLNKLEGFQNSYFLSNFSKTEIEKPPYYTVLKVFNKSGSFRQSDRRQTEVTSIDDVQFDKSGELRFSIAVDLSMIPEDSSYLTNPKNYSIPNSFNIISIEKADRNKLSNWDWLAIQNPSDKYIITVSTTSKFPIQNLQLSLLNQTPQWVSETESPNLDDHNVKKELNSTFGISYLIGGVAKAYEEENKPQKSVYFTLTVVMSNEKVGESPLTTIFIWLAVIGISVFIIFILLKRRNQN